MVYGDFEMKIFIFCVFILFFIFYALQTPAHDINSNEILIKSKENIK